MMYMNEATSPLAYCYTGEGEYSHAEPCQFDPLESEQKGEAVWLLPANSTFTAPPAAEVRKAAVWNGTAWELREDNRGTKYWLPGDTWQTEPREMKDLGPLPDGAMLDRPEKPFSQLKIEKMFELNAAYQKAIAEMTPGYPEAEKLSFDKQEQEARAWLADDTALTPFVDALAAGRGMEKAELVRRIILKANAFALASGSLTGQRQRYEDMLEAAQDAEAVAAIVPQYSLPGMEAQV